MFESLRLSFSFVVLFLLQASSAPAAQSFDVEVTPGDNFAKAEFRLWIEEDHKEPLRGLIVLVPGSNSDGRNAVADPFWQALARAHGFGLVGVHFKDRRHENMAAEHYVDVRRDSGSSFFQALQGLAQKAQRPEVENAPLFLWGMSAGGEFNYELALWKPERILGFVVNKGGIYYNVLASKAAREVPGLFFIGEKDSSFRNDIIRGIYSVNRRFHAHWALAVEPDVGHSVARSRDLAAIFFEELVALRRNQKDTVVPASLKEGGARFSRLPYEKGFFGDPRTLTIESVASAERKDYPVAWLASERLAQAWLAVVTGEPFGE